ncbi:hypothetical protein ABPG74_020526 [Tetrahymena malaccensis]
MGGLANNGHKVYKLGRAHSQRFHLIRTQLTQLVMHERITTTKTKCKHLKPYAERLLLNAVRVAKTNSNQSRSFLQSFLTTSLARRKIVKEIAARMGDKNNNFINVRFLSERRRGDKAEMGYIEIKGNELENYEKSLEREQIEKGEVPDLKAFKEKIFKQERDFLADKLQQAEENISLQKLENVELLEKGKIDVAEFNRREKAAAATKAFFEAKLKQVEHDLFICNKNKYDLIKYITY